jgi:AraC-like DNA-binding protein
MRARRRASRRARFALAGQILPTLVITSIGSFYLPAVTIQIALIIMLHQKRLKLLASVLESNYVLGNWLICLHPSLFRPETHDSWKEDLDEHCQENLTLGELGRQMAFSKYYLSRRFHREIGLSAHAYLIQTRIRQSNNLLSEGKSILETVPILGFHD